MICVYRREVSCSVGNHVVLKGDRTGYIRYLGHLDNVGKPTAIFAGIQLDAPGK